MQIEFRASKALLLTSLSTLRNARGRRRFIATHVAATA
jgi:hypothetical protein